MIALIDTLRHLYNNSISKAIDSQSALEKIDSRFADLGKVPTVHAIDEMNKAANGAINDIAKAQHAANDPSATINVGGDFYKVGDITDSENIAIGRDIDQTQTNNEPDKEPDNGRKHRPPGTRRNQ